MTEFEITVNGNKETIHAKHIANGNFLVRKLKTRNDAQVKYIETLFADNKSKQYQIKSFYPSSHYYGMEPVTQTVRLIRNVD